MPTFQYTEAQSLDEAVALLSQPGAAAVGGGTDLLPQVKDGIIPADQLVGLAAIPGMAAIAETADGLTIGAAAAIADVAAHPAIRRRYAALAEAAGGLATPQIRNEGTIGGNLNQRPRCWHYRSPLIPCLKKGGDRCYALAGNTRLLCVTGGDRCYIVHPSDTAVALRVLDARLATAGPKGEREMAIGEFFAGPGRDMLRENVLEPGELITRIVLPSDAPERSVYLKVRERESGDFALVSAAAALSLDNGVISQARIALGGVAPVPYRAAEVEDYLTGRPASDVDPAEAAALALPNATPLPHNGYKLPMSRNIVKRALTLLLGNA
jgi:xanthine dehydrogenase YagS FAD-binding subunit